MFGSILNFNDILGADRQYVFTFTLGVIFFQPSSDLIKQELSAGISNIGTVMSVKRPLFSDHYEIVVIPSVSLPLSDWLSVFDSIFKWIDYPDYIFISAEGGAVSSAPGGIEEIFTSAGEIVGSTTASTAKALLTPFMSYILIGGAIYIGILMLPSLLDYRR